MVNHPFFLLCFLAGDVGLETESRESQTCWEIECSISMAFFQPFGYLYLNSFLGKKNMSVLQSNLRMPGICGDGIWFEVPPCSRFGGSSLCLGLVVGG